MAIPQAILFIDEDYLKRFSTINGSVDPTFLEPKIIVAQDIWIQELLGSNLYEKLQTLIQTGDILLAANVDYRNLLEKRVMSTTLHWSLVEILPDCLYKINNGSLSTFSSEDSTAITRGELDRLIETERDKAQFYSERLISYLCANSSKFPEYSVQVTSDQMCPTKSSIYYEGGMEIG